GYDGSLNIEKLTENFVQSLELSGPVYLGRKFDWVLSLEVGEHIPAQFEDIFLENLNKHADKGIILSWAVPGQYGLGHVNPRSNDYIISKMEEKGLIHDPESQKFLRSNIGLKYFQNTLMVFRKY
ncbi:UNVERIFIED_CONTAM: hypothetical protein GTU68_020771, partial [Idotea baltica]|nr:hypothetical protein [Idotea baltica]